MEYRGLWEEDTSNDTQFMDKVYVVKSVNTDKDSLILTDDMGLGVFLTFEDAKICYDLNVKELKELYEKYDPDSVYIYEDKEISVPFFSFYIHCDYTGFSDYVGLYECEIGQWNDTDLKDFKYYKKVKNLNN